jgi:stearoyl-CoA desaturase (delta-9 desaturase)
MAPSPTSTKTLAQNSPLIKSSEEPIKLKEILREAPTEDSSNAPPLDIVWRNVFLFIYLHGAAAYGAYLWVKGEVMWQTFLWAFMFYVMSGFGITAGAHRYWAHKSYKAKTPLRIFLAYMQTVAFQNHIYEWCRDHRVHHKFTETHADPHNARRGFFFAHIGWLLCRKHDDVKIKGKCVDMSDLEQDQIVMFQKKYYLPLVLTCCFVVPTLVPWIFWNETFLSAYFFAAQFRYCATLHCTWLVNSAAHLWGPRPYDKTINPAENKSVAWWAFGEGWHNYHHVFPWDYKTAEVGIYRYNFSAAFIDFFAKIGLAYDLKSVPEKIVMQRVMRTGDGSHHHHSGVEKGPWGWGDVDTDKGDIEVTEILYPVKAE